MSSGTERNRWKLIDRLRSPRIRVTEVGNSTRMRSSIRTPFYEKRKEKRSYSNDIALNILLRERKTVAHGNTVCF